MHYTSLNFPYCRPEFMSSHPMPQNGSCHEIFLFCIILLSLNDNRQADGWIWLQRMVVALFPRLGVNRNGQDTARSCSSAQITSPLKSRSKVWQSVPDFSSMQCQVQQDLHPVKVWPKPGSGCTSSFMWQVKPDKWHSPPDRFKEDL